MPSIHAQAVANFKAAADLLAAVNSSRINLISDLSKALVNRPKLQANGGYETLTPEIAISVPSNARAECMLAEDQKNLELRSTGTPAWLTLEVKAPTTEEVSQVYFEAQLLGAGEVTADVFFRCTEGSTSTDVGHTSVQIKGQELAVISLPFPEAAQKASNVRTIVYLRGPASRLIFQSLSLSYL